MKKIPLYAAPLIAIASLTTPDASAVEGGEAPSGIVAESVSMIGDPNAGICSGVAISKHWTLTAAHCALNTETVGPIVRGANLSGTVSEQGTAIKHAQSDLALVKTKEENTVCSPLGKDKWRTGDAIRKGQNVHFTGFGGSPRGARTMHSTVLEGAHLETKTTPDGKNWTAYYTTMDKTPDASNITGDSGGPLLDDNGKILAVFHGSSPGSEVTTVGNISKFTVSSNAVVTNQAKWIQSVTGAQHLYDGTTPAGECSDDNGSTTNVETRDAGSSTTSGIWVFFQRIADFFRNLPALLSA